MSSPYNPYTSGGSLPYVHQPQPHTPPTGGQIVPGTITYTTSTGPDGRVIYHPFKAVSASYQTSSGIVAGIQWVPAEATQILPAGAQPANADFAASWNRGYISNEDKKALKEWQKDEDKRRKKEEKEAAKRMRDRDHDARKAMEREHEHRKSFNVGSIPGTDPGYPTTAYSPSTGYHAADIDRRFADMGLDSRRDEDKHRHARSSSGAGIYGPPVYATGGPGPGYPTSRGHTFPGAGPPFRSPSRGASPNMRPGDVMGSVYSAPLRGEPIARSSSPFGASAPLPSNPNVYPRGHIMEGQPIIPRSRATTPVPGTQAGSGLTGFPQPTIPVTGASPHNPINPFPGDQQPLAAPEAFSRPLNTAQSYTAFETMKVVDMDDFLDGLPKMPFVLQTHDVYHNDWTRFTQDLARAWSGNLPVPDYPTSHHRKRSTLSIELVDVWNKSFFVVRGVEVALYKGREKRTGPDAGSIDPRLPGFNDDSSSSSSASSSESESSDGGRGAGAYGAYNRGSAYPDSHEARIRRQEKKAEKKRRAKEKKHKKKAKQREKKYALYLIYVQPGAGASPYVPMGGRASPMPNRASPLIGTMGGRTSPMPGGGYNPIGGRTSPMPGGYAGGRTSPMPGGYAGGRTSPMPGGYGAMGGRSSPMPGGYGGRGY